MDTTDFAVIQYLEDMVIEFKKNYEIAENTFMEYEVIRFMKKLSDDRCSNNDYFAELTRIHMNMISKCRVQSIIISSVTSKMSIEKIDLSILGDAQDWLQ
jgi:hypothetical protein